MTEKLIENAKNLNSKLEQDQESIVADAETYLTAIGAAVNKIVLQLIDELKEGATEDGVAVLECVNGQEDNTNKAWTETITLAATCLSEESSALLAVANQILENVQSIEEEVKAQVETLEACTSSDLLCLIAFGESAISIGNDIVTNVSTDINSVVAVIQEVIDHVASCNLLDNVKSNTQNIFNNLVLCIKA